MENSGESKLRENKCKLRACEEQIQVRLYLGRDNLFTSCSDSGVNLWPWNPRLPEELRLSWALEKNANLQDEEMEAMVQTSSKG